MQEISARLEIYDIYDRYAHAADEHDIPALSAIFLPSTTFDWTSTGGGKMTFAEACVGPVFTGKLFPWAFHATSNVRIKFLEEGTKAEVKVKTISPSGLEGEGGGEVDVSDAGRVHGSFGGGGGGVEDCGEGLGGGVGCGAVEEG